MKFNFIVSKWANFYFFVSNLSEWHFSCRKDYNEIWLKQDGQFKEKEITSLNEFKKILLKYKFNLGKIFYIYNEKKAWTKLKKLIKKSEFEKIKLAFEILEPRFQLIWKGSKKQLNKRVKLFKLLLNKTECKDLLNNLCLFFNNKKLNDEINIIAIASPLGGEAITAAGGANINNKHITLEIPDLKINSWELEYSFGIIAHEIAHILFKKLNDVKIINEVISELKAPKKMPKNLIPKQSTMEFMIELIIESLVPLGYLSKKYFKKFDPIKISFSKSNLKVLAENFLNYKQNKLSSTHRLRKFLIWQLYPLIIYQIESKKNLDKDFIKKTICFVLNTIKNKGSLFI